MPTLRYETIVARPIGQVWAAFQDMALLATLTPPSQGLLIESAEPLPPRLGTVVTLSMRSPIGRVRWTVEYTDFSPPHATVTGTEARFIDTQMKGPFKRWSQAHEFEAADDRRTRCIDVIDYAPPLGPVGWLGDVLALRWMIRRTVAYRHRKLVELFGKG